MVLLTSRCSIKVAKEALDNFLSFIAKINTSLVVGCFEMDFGAQEVDRIYLFVSLSDF